VANYLVFFYSEWEMDPAYYCIDLVRGTSPKHALESNLPKLIQTTRKLLGLDSEIDDDYIAEMFYIVPDDQWLSFRHTYWQVLED